jgi:hypothetical protein
MSQSLSLEDFASRLVRQPTCRLCLAPSEVKEPVEANERAGLPISRPTVIKWSLAEHGYQLGLSTLKSHAANHMDAK